jgi:uncharacterized protein YndB with AHSA1/START domain
MTDDSVVELSLHVAAEPETVFPYFTDPARYIQWMGRDATLDPVPGGIYRVRIRDGIEAVGQFVEVDPPRGLVFTWGWAGDQEVPPGSTHVSITLHPEAGGTRVVLRHHDLPDQQQRDHHSKGWELYLSRLGSVMAGHDPGEDPNA